MSDDLAGLRQHDRRALARLISRAARGERLDELRRQLGPPAKHSRVVALTGAGGVGKSSLVGKLIEQFRSQGKSVAVLACDPQSPLTGGALLGDRFRMPNRPDDAGVYIRSLAAPPGRQAVADHLETIVLLCEHFGFDFVLIETVGSGQGDTAVREVADGVVLLLQPETGDDLQWEKAGVLEVADIVVVHKADLPGADKTVAQIQSMLALSAGRDVPVLPVSSRTGAGISELAAALAALPPRRRDQDDAERLLKLAQEALAEHFRRGDMADIVAAWRGGLPTTEAVRRLLNRMAPA